MQYLVVQCILVSYGGVSNNTVQLLSEVLFSFSQSSAVQYSVSRPGAAGEDELRQLFGLYGQTTGKGTVSR